MRTWTSSEDSCFEEAVGCQLRAVRSSVICQSSRHPMDLDAFLADRQPRWDRLEALLDAAEASPEWELGCDRLLELVRLYRLSCTDLNRLRSLTANPSLLGRVNQLVGRAYRFVYRGAPQ